ncbi:MAG: AMP-binding protein [Pseudomonadota bacterium]
MVKVPMLRSQQDIQALNARDFSDFVQGNDIYHFIETACRQTPDKAAFVVLEDPSLKAEAPEVSFQTVLDNVTRAANLFYSVGARRDNAVSMLAPVTPEALCAMWGAMTASIANPVNPFLEIEHIAGVLKAANTKILIAAGLNYDPETAKKAEALRALVPSLSHIYYLGQTPNAAALSFTDALAEQNGEQLNFDRNPSLNHTAAYFHTGGTTGTPKLAKHTHLGQLLNAFLCGLVLGNEEHHTEAHGMPLFHVGGAIALSLRSLIHNQTSVHLTPNGFRTPEVVQNFWSIVEKYGVRSTIAVPTVCAALLNNTDAPAKKTPLEFLATGASTVPEELSIAFHKKFGVHMRELWGMTEIHGIATSNLPFGEPVTGSAGTVLPFQNLKVIEQSEGRFVRECKTNEAGLVIFSGKTVIDEYVDSEHTQKGFIEGMPDGGRWLNTGDLGRLDENGYVWIIGRLKDLIIRGGHNIDPIIIEDALLAHEAVALAAAVGRPDGLKGEMPVAYVQLKPDAEAKADDVLKFASERIPERAAIPDEVIIIEAMPVTAVGKIFKPDLRVDVTIRTVKDIVSSLDANTIDYKVEAYFDKLEGLTVNCVLSGDKTACESLKANLGQKFVSYPFKVNIELKRYLT